MGQDHAPEPAGTETVEVVVAVASEQFAAVVQDLRTAGLDVRDELSVLGTVTGRADPRVLPVLRRLPGVVAVEVSRDIHLPPPASDLQ
jgi:hypothetical protein